MLSQNKGSLLESMVPWRTFNIHGNFPLDKRFLDSQNVLENGSFKNQLLSDCLGNLKWFFYGITSKTPIWNHNF